MNGVDPNWLSVAVAAISAIGALGYLQYVLHRYARAADETARTTLGTRVTALEVTVAALRDELHGGYVRTPELRDLRTDMRADFDRVFDRLNGISREMSEMVGRLGGRTVRAVAAGGSE